MVGYLYAREVPTPTLLIVESNLLVLHPKGQVISVKPFIDAERKDSAETEQDTNRDYLCI